MIVTELPLLSAYCMPSFGLSNLRLFLQALQQPLEGEAISFPSYRIENQGPEREKDWP